MLAISTDCGASWHSETIAYTNNSFPKSIAVDPANHDILYVGGRYYSSARGYCGYVYRSADAGESWSACFISANGNIVYSVGVDPSHSANVYYATEQGIFKSSDSGGSWTPALDGAVNALALRGNGEIFAGGADFIKRSCDAGASWETVVDSAGFMVNHGCMKIDETNEMLYAGTQSGMLSFDLGSITGIGGEPPRGSASSPVLAENYPNPFNPVTTIRYTIPAAAHVSVVIYDALGKRIRTLTGGVQKPGSHAVVWDGANDAGEKAASGVYLYVVRAGLFSVVKKMVLLR